MALILTDGASYYLYGPGGVPYAQITTAGVTTYLHTDQLGSVRMITSASGTSVGTATYTAYGTRTTTGTTSPFGYAGQYTDTETGLIYLRARYYDPTTAQFLTVDPLAATTGTRYSYALGNPITGADPTGLWSDNPWVNVGIGLGVVALAATGVGLFVEGTALVAGITAAAAGAGAAILDVQPCRAGDPYACGGAVMGGAGVIAGFGGLGVLGYEAIYGATADTGAVGAAFGVAGLELGGIGTGIDTIGAVRASGGATGGLSGGCGGW